MTCLVALLMLALWGAQAQAAPGCTPEVEECPPLGIQFGTYGSGTSEIDNPRGLATSPLSGHIFVGEHGNPRVSEFDEKGTFVKAWGWGVVASGPGNQPRNEIQQVEVDATAGTFKLNVTFFQTTISIPFDASAATVQNALEGLSDSEPPPKQIGSEPGDILVGGPNGGPWQIEFAGANADLDINQMQITSSTLSGGVGAIVRTIQPGAKFEVCRAADGDVCRAGQLGVQAGQLNSPRLAVDEAGSIWALERDARRLQKFSPEGEFLLMAGGEVNKTKVAEREEQEKNLDPVTITEAEENLCSAASGDLCGAATSGTGDGQFKALGLGNGVAAGPGGVIYVGDESRIQEFDEEGVYQGDIPLAGAGVTRALTVDSSGRIYVISEGIKESIDAGGGFGTPSRVVREIGPTGEELDRLTGSWQERKTPLEPTVLASDAEGNVYVVGQVVYDVPVEPGEEPKTEKREEVVAFDQAGDLISFEPDQAGFGRRTDTSEIVAIATNVRSAGSEEPGPVYLGQFDNGGLGSIGGPKSYVRSFGQFGDPEPKPPVVASHYATAVSADDANVEAQISPSFAKDTTFWVEYGTGKCSEGGCDVATAPTPLGGTANDTPRGTGGVSLTGLTPGTTYHYRFVAESEGGGPVEGAEATFTTYAIPTASAPCPNDALRAGAGALLPDCRGYEMVSPLGKDGGETIALRDSPGFPVELTQGDVAGEKLTYSSYRAFADPAAAPYTSQYLAERRTGGWVTESISPRREEGLFPDLRNQYKLFSPDLSRAWLQSDSEPVLAPGGLEGYRNLYRRDNVAGGYVPQCATEPAATEPSDFLPEIQGVAADGSHLVFRANGKLTEDAAEISATQIYECVDGSELRLVSVLPGGGVVAGASVGSASAGKDHARRASNVTGAISSDGSRVFWTATTFGPGPLYVRIDGAVTVEIAAANARFRQASADGTRVIYTVGDELLAATVGAGAASSETIAGEVEGVMGASKDAQLLYFVSREDLDGAGEAQAGEPNLYLHRAGPDTHTFIARLSEDDAREEVASGSEETPTLTPVARSPYERSGRVTADGLHAAFTSTAPLTGYENTDTASGNTVAEVFVYDAEAGQLRCASCNPSGARPRGAKVGEPNFWAAAIIPGWEDQFYASRALSEDGNRLFFEAVDALALGDTNGVTDVYQWEEPGHGSCSTASPTYSPPAGGCIDLISSGKSPEPSTLVDASADGADVFFKTEASLWAPDPGLLDIYDARIGGGFPAPPVPPPACEGDACRSPAPSPLFQSPTSGTYVGPGDQPPKGKKKAGKRRCPKGKHKVKRKGKVRCARNRGKKKGKTRRANRAGHHRRAAR